MANEIIKKENQQRVLKKAMEICAEKGFEQMSLNKLAKESMLSVRSIYRYYDTKDALIKNIVEVAVASLKDELTATMMQKGYEELDGAHKVISLCRTMLQYAKSHCKLQSKLVAAEPYLCEIGVPDVFSLIDTTDNVVTRWFLAAFRDGVKDGSINSEIVDNERNFRTLAVVYRGFYSRIAMICADDTISRHYAPEQLIEDYLKHVYRFIAMGEIMVQRRENDYEV